jgi:hypothetical protein
VGETWCGPDVIAPRCRNALAILAQRLTTTLGPVHSCRRRTPLQAQTFQSATLCPCNFHVSISGQARGIGLDRRRTGGVARPSVAWDGTQCSPLSTRRNIFLTRTACRSVREKSAHGKKRVRHGGAKSTSRKGTARRLSRPTAGTGLPLVCPSSGARLGRGRPGGGWGTCCAEKRLPWLPDAWNARMVLNCVDHPTETS